MNFFDSILASVIKIKHLPVVNMLVDPVACQEKLMHEFVYAGKDTLFGSDHFFLKIKNYKDFKNCVPLRNYEELLPYIERIKSGESDVLWKGRPVFFGKTSGTTSKTKYIPVTKDSLKNQMGAPQYAAFNYASHYKKYSFLKGKVLLFSDGHFFEDMNGIKAAPISTIANSCVPGIYKLFRLPSDKINSITEYEKRIDAMINVSAGKDIRTIVAMPVWLLVYLRALKRSTGKEFKELFPNFKLLLLSGMDYEPFLPEIKKYINMPFDVLETYPSTEGFIAYQDRLEKRGMQLVLNNGIFFEFVPVNELYQKDAKRIWLKDVEPGVNYALVLNTNAGLWGYINGDTVRFKTVFPHRVDITGRIAQYISAFGEHVTEEETDKSISETAKEYGATIVEYTVAPNINEDGILPYHEWFIEFGEIPESLDDFALQLDNKICFRNFSYKDLVVHKAIEPLKIRLVPADGFEKFLRVSGKKGWQQKIPHVRNDYQLAQQLNEILSL
ncbi:MAG TPA: GH3 auxin-responsive promoter family protein [Chitinophagaceae bacterium]|nr:GH3 auxin-responsive promoter family protein [Chitinophagaceae bacterium]